MAIQPRLGIQWHITNKCNQRCRHCYLKRRSRQQMETAELSLKECFALVGNLAASAERLGATPSIDLTGGDPLLSEHIWDVLAYLHERDVPVSILGNSYEVNDTTAARLKELGVGDYQISVDGLQDNHDWLRKKGSFADTMRAFDVLQKNRIATGIMFTITRRNSDDLVPVMRIAAQKKLHAFAFDVVTPNGADEALGDIMLAPLELRDVYLKYIQEAEELARRGFTTVFARKNSLHFLIAEESGNFYPVRSDARTIFAGCPIGQGLTICADGKVIPCPRMPITIGHALEEDLADILLYSEFLNRFRKRENFQKCANCTLFQYCRGCPANAFAVKGNCFSGDPYCWKKLDLTLPPPLSPEKKVQFGQGCPLTEREKEIMGSYYAWQFKERMLKSDLFQEILGRAMRDVSFRGELHRDVKGTCAKYGYDVGDLMLYELSRIEFSSIFNLLEQIQ